MANWAALEIDPDIRQATTLPGWCYSDPDTHRAAVDRIVHYFHRLFAAAMRGHAG